MPSLDDLRGQQRSQLRRYVDADNYNREHPSLEGYEKVHALWLEQEDLLERTAR